MDKDQISVKEIVKLIQGKGAIVEVYDIIIKNLNIAKKKMAEGDPEKSAYIKKASSIIFALSLSVNKEAGKLADNLRKLYSHSISSLIWADVQNNVEEIKNIEKIIKTLKKGFE
jgi:flagellar protein FliS